jgi:hypothetical protein
MDIISGILMMVNQYPSEALVLSGVVSFITFILVWDRAKHVGWKKHEERVALDRAKAIWLSTFMGKDK